MSRRLVRCAVGAATLSLLTGCLGIRPDTTVHTGLGVEEPVPDPVYYLPAGPTPGATPEEIITGFLHADEVTAERLSVAQSFLTKSLVATWDPGVTTEVIDPAHALDITSTGQRWYAVKAPLVSAIDSAGRAASAPEGSVASMSVHLTQVDGQWRIDQTSADFGRWVRTTSLDQVMRPVTLYYPALVGRTLIPDVRWLPVTRLATGLTRALLGPPPTYLEGAVRTGLATAQLGGAVAVRGGVATVPLEAGAAYGQSETRSDIWAQLAATLTQAPSISGVTVTVDGAVLEAARAVPPVLSASELGFRDLDVAAGVQPMVRFGDRVFATDINALLRSDADPVHRESPFPDVPKAWSGLALSFTGEELAARGSDGTGLARYRNGQSVEPEGFAQKLTAPTYDRFGYLWVGGEAFDPGSTARLWTIDSNAGPFNGSGVAAQPVPVAWLSRRLPVAVAVSVDGSRIAIVSTNEAGKDARLDIAGVGRDAGGAPTLVSATPLRLAGALDHLRDVVWTSPTEVAVLAGPDTKALPYLVTLGDDITPLAPIDRAASITTLGGSRNLAIVSDQGHAFVRAGDHWQALPSSASELVSPGR